MKSETKKTTDTTLIRRKAEGLLKEMQSKSISLTEIETIKLLYELEVYQIELEMQKEELQLAKDEAEINAEKYTNLYDYAPAAKFTLNSNGGICQLNFTAAKMLNKERSNLINSNFKLFITTETRSLFVDFLDKITDSKTKQDCEVRLVIDEKPSVFVHIEGILLENEKNYLLTVFDVSKRKHDEIELILAKEKAVISEDYLDNIINNIGDPIFVKDEQSRILMVNDAFCELFIMERDTIIGKTLAEDVSPDEGERFLKTDKQVLNTGEKIITEHSLTLRGEPIRTISTKKTRYIDSNNNKYIIGIARDLTEYKIAEELLKETLSQNELAVDISKLGVWQLNIDSGELLWNDRHLEFYGITREEFTNDIKGWSSQLHPDDQNYAISRFNEVYENKSIHDLNFRIIRPNGEIRYLSAAGVPIFVHGKLVKVIGVNRDITDTKRSEKQLKDTLLQLTELKQQTEAENIYLKEELKLEGSFNEIVGSSKPLRKVLKQVEQVANTDSTVLILGETGTGKELIARAIHNASDRKDKPMVKVNCSALPANLIESELFGHEKGAFTGALKRKIGRFELANGGTIFLDEIGDLPLELQTRLLRVLQESEFERLGGEKTIKVDVRVITATNRNLDKQVLENKFRQDLYYRLNVFPIRCPQLRNRVDDIQSLVHHFINKYNPKVNNKIKTVHQKTIERLMHYNWPGNIRELEHVIERAIIMNKGGQLRLGSWFMDSNIDTVVTDDFKTMETVERNYIIKVLEKTNWKIRGKNGAAEILGMQPTTLESRIKKRGIKR
jgi:PAS domain S-box-containing protein